NRQVSQRTFSPICYNSSRPRKNATPSRPVASERKTRRPAPPATALTTAPGDARGGGALEINLGGGASRPRFRVLVVDTVYKLSEAGSSASHRDRGSEVMIKVRRLMGAGALLGVAAVLTCADVWGGTGRFQEWLSWRKADSRS